jgi:hypothetical protein
MLKLFPFLFSGQRKSPSRGAREASIKAKSSNAPPTRVSQEFQIIERAPAAMETGEHC